MSNPPAISASWALQQSATDVYTVAKGVLEAATSDNVQPLALLACESFGATLACCEQTMLKVEQAAGRRGVSAVLKFIQAQVGYSSNDSAAYLVKSTAGVRFMSLATALHSLGTDFEGAQGLSAMIEEAAGTDQLRPTIRQLQDLLRALQVKLIQAGFANLIMGYQIFLRQHPNIPVNYVAGEGELTGCPQAAVVKQLVDSFRLLGRIGIATDENFVGTYHCVITTGRSFAWLLAFIHWTFGAPPAVYWKSIDDEVCLILKSQSKILLRLIAGADSETCRGLLKPDVEVQMFESIMNLPRLWRSDSNAAIRNKSGYWRGVVSVANWGQERIEKVIADWKLTKDALIRVIEDTLAWVRHVENESILEDYNGVATSRCDLLPSLRKLCDAFKEYTGSTPKNSFMPIDSSCKAPDASTTHAFIADDSNLEQELVRMCTEIIAVAAFDSAEDVMPLVRNSPFIQGVVKTRLYDRVLDIIRFGGYRNNHLTCIDVVACARNFVGHDTEDFGLVTSYLGRVIWPALLESLDPQPGSFLSLQIAPGSLRYKDIEYAYVGTPSYCPPPSSVNESPFSISGSIDRPLNLFRDRRLEWSVTAKVDHLETAFGIGGSSSWTAPYDCFESVQRCIFAQRCAHPADSPIRQTDIVSTLKLVEPGHPSVDCMLRDPAIDGILIGPGDLIVFPVARSGGLRLYSIAVGGYAVVRGEACLSCCLKVCKATDRQVLIL